MLKDIGSLALDRDAGYPPNSTIIDMANPAEVSGTITSLEVWAVTSHSITGFRVGTFYSIGGGKYKCRDSVTIGSVTDGSKQTFPVLIAVEAGDYIGCYFTGGWLERTITPGYLQSVSGEYIDPGDEALCDIVTGSISLYGIISSIGFHSTINQRRYKDATFSTFTFPDPAGMGFTAATDGYSMLAGWGIVGRIQVLLSGTLNLSGSLGRKVKKSLSGSLTSGGVLNAALRFPKILYGALNLSGSLAGVRKILLGGVLNSSGVLSRKIKKGLAGTLNLSGTIKGGLTFYKSLVGVLNSSGALASAFRFSKTLAGTLNLSGSLIKLVKKNLAGVLNSSGTLGRKIWHKLSGTVNFSGALSYGMGLVYKSLAGTLNFSGSLNRKIRKSLSGTVSFIGTLTSFFATFFVHRYVIEIHDSAGNLLAILKNAYNISLEETVNAPKTLSFKCPADEPNLVYLTRGNEIWVRDVKNNIVLAKTRLLRDDDTR